MGLSFTDLEIHGSKYDIYFDFINIFRKIANIYEFEIYKVYIEPEVKTKFKIFKPSLLIKFFRQDKLFDLYVDFIENPEEIVNSFRKDKGIIIQYYRLNYMSLTPNFNTVNYCLIYTQWLVDEYSSFSLESILHEFFQNLLKKLNIKVIDFQTKLKIHKVGHSHMIVIPKPLTEKLTLDFAILEKVIEDVSNIYLIYKIPKKETIHYKIEKT